MEEKTRPMYNVLLSTNTTYIKHLAQRETNNTWSHMCDGEFIELESTMARVGTGVRKGNTLVNRYTITTPFEGCV